MLFVIFLASFVVLNPFEFTWILGRWSALPQCIVIHWVEGLGGAYVITVFVLSIQELKTVHLGLHASTVHANYSYV